MNNQTQHQYTNGRVNITEPNIATRFAMSDRIPINGNTNYQNSLAGNMTRSRLSDAFFSNQNIQIIQNGIRKGVYDRSQQQILIDKQPEDQIVSVMRSMYLQYSNNLETNITEQIQQLNGLVLTFCINNTYSEAVAYIKYRRDASTMYTPMTAPIYSSKRNKTLEQKMFF